MLLQEPSIFQKITVNIMSARIQNLNSIPTTIQGREEQLRRRRRRRLQRRRRRRRRWQRQRWQRQRQRNGIIRILGPRYSSDYSSGSLAFWSQTGQARPGQARPNLTRPTQYRPCHAMPPFALFSQTNLGRLVLFCKIYIINGRIGDAFWSIRIANPMRNQS